VPDALQALLERVRPSLLAKLEIIEDVLASRLEADPSPDRLEQAQRAAHQLAGSAGTFGMPQATVLARELETYCRRGAPVDPAVLLPAFAQLEKLRLVLEASAAVVAPRAAETPSGPDDETTPDLQTTPDLMIAVADEATALRMLGAARLRGRSGVWFGDLASALAATTSGSWATALIDLDLPGGSPDQPQDAGMRLLRALADAQPDSVAWVLDPGDGLVDRVEASRAGAYAFLPDDREADETIATITAAADTGPQDRYRIVAVDDDPLILAALEGLFTGEGMEITIVSDPLRLWKVMAESPPDLVLLDVDMPGVTGLELCGMIRRDPHWALLPVLVLTGSIGPHEVTEVFAAGADDYASKPIVAAELLTRVRNRLERVRLQRRMAEIDPLTGLVNRTVLIAAFDRLRGRALQQNQPLSVAMIDLDRFRRFNDAFGHALGDVVLQRLARQLTSSFSGVDVVARWAGQEIAVVMYGMNRFDGVARVSKALEEFAFQDVATPDGPRSLTFSAGVAELGPDGADLQRLAQSAGRAVVQAKRAGGERVMPAGWSEDADPALVDVVLVEDDEVLAGLLVHALQTRGLRVVHLDDGLVALSRLTGADRLRPRVVVLDVDIPGLNGFDLLGQLSWQGLLAHVRVLMLTARSGEQEVLASLRQGAFDHVAKPFNLLQRIRRALDS